MGGRGPRAGFAAVAVSTREHRNTGNTRARKEGHGAYLLVTALFELGDDARLEEDLARTDAERLGVDLRVRAQRQRVSSAWHTWVGNSLATQTLSAVMSFSQATLLSMNCFGMASTARSSYLRVPSGPRAKKRRVRQGGFVKEGSSRRVRQGGFIRGPRNHNHITPQSRTAGGTRQTAAGSGNRGGRCGCLPAHRCTAAGRARAAHRSRPPSFARWG